MSDGYLFPTPGFVLRSLLDELAAGDEEFTEHQATADIMLAADGDDVKPVRYYAERWHWSKSKVHRRMDELKARARRWRCFNQTDGKVGHGWDSSGTEVGQQWDTDGTTVGQESPSNGDKRDNRDAGGTPMGQEWDNGGTTVGQARDSIVQSTDTDTNNKHSHTRGARPREDPVEVLKDMWGVSPSNYQADRIRQTVDDLSAWKTILRGFLMEDKQSKRAIGWAFEDYQEQIESTNEDGQNEESKAGDDGWNSDFLANPRGED